MKAQCNNGRCSALPAQHKPNGEKQTARQLQWIVDSLKKTYHLNDDEAVTATMYLVDELYSGLNKALTAAGTQSPQGILSATNTTGGKDVLFN
jgi:hypothetical protein